MPLNWIVAKLRGEEEITFTPKRTPMNTLTFPGSACRYCRHYNVEGRRGGMCKQLGVPVRGTWKACSLALPPFAPSWESLDGLLQDNKVMLEEALSVNCSLEAADPEPAEVKTFISSEPLTIDMVLV